MYQGVKLLTRKWRIAYLDGGTPKALACLQCLLPATEWAPLDQLCATLYTVYDIQVPLPSPYEPLETLIGHNFKLPSLLLEAITHPSHHGQTPSYQRLEFLGDSILDRIITVAAFNSTPPIETHTLHLMYAHPKAILPHPPPKKILNDAKSSPKPSIHIQNPPTS